MLTPHTALMICLCGSTPISALAYPQTSSPLPLNMLTLLLHPQDMPSPLLMAPPTRLILSSAYHPPEMPPMLPSPLLMPPHPRLVLSAPYNYYTPAVP
ncbi:hypothetical protein O181_030987 [Austropuccinia psidii MF-1]|uniref:Uncharacterized protein n=1 Tax=Austropuccinia psidii MF-1 TaxID=1389203 RepID=A0A9Q3CWS6_9BASI|nr:hypothetical protein [Austropuccinia psidii MF-1]